MGGQLQGRKVAILATDGVEQVELTEPRKALEQAGALVHLVAPKAGRIQGMNHHDKGDQLEVDRELSQVSARDYDALMLPGGVANPDALRREKAAVAFVRDFMDADKPIAAICHAPWLLIEADVVRGRTLTSWPSLETDVRNAGGDWVDRAVVADEKLVTSRKPDDLPQFNAKMVSLFASAIAERQVDRMSEQSFPASDPPPGPMTIGPS
jgi:protease I